MSRYEAMFATVDGAFVPFLMLGDPDPATSLDLVRALLRGGADALELGIPFSDPVADGPVIQAAAARALGAGATVRQAWDIIAAVRRESPTIPIGLLVYANLVLHRSAIAFYRDASSAGVDSVLVADLPLREAGPVDQVALDHGIAPVHIAPPNADPVRLAAIARASRGYVYVTSRAGVTGADDRLHAGSRRIIAGLREAGAPPALIGFGVSRPAHVREAIELGAAGAISGSAVVRRVEANLGRREVMIEGVEGFVREMKAATGAQVG
jgi:tryptophan synthase alpha chain